MENKLIKAFSYAIDLDEKVRLGRGSAFTQDEFDRVTKIFQYPQTQNGQKKFFDVLNKLSTENLLIRIRQTSNLINALNCLQKNKR